MKMTTPLKGYLLALLSVVAISNVYIFSKVALKEVSLPQFGVYWFGLGYFSLLGIVDHLMLLRNFHCVVI